MSPFRQLDPRITKRCSECKCNHPLSEFGPDRSRPDGLNSRCLKSAAARKRAKYSPKPKITRSLAERFWSKVEKTDTCWNWKTLSASKRYGHIGLNGATERAHRVSWVLHFGHIPDGLCVLHRCDNRACVRPDHLFLGDHRDNAIDMTQKGRRYQPRPEQMPRGDQHVWRGKLFGNRLKKGAHT